MSSVGNKRSNLHPPSGQVSYIHMLVKSAEVQLKGVGFEKKKKKKKKSQVFHKVIAHNLISQTM